VIEQRRARDSLLLCQFLHRAERRLGARARRLDLPEQQRERDCEADRGEQQEQRKGIAQGDAPGRLRDLDDAHEGGIAPMGESRADSPHGSGRVTVCGRL
jgi:hypothetical protein